MKIASIGIRNIGNGTKIVFSHYVLTHKLHGNHQNKGCFTLIYKARQERFCVLIIDKVTDNVLMDPTLSRYNGFKSQCIAFLLDKSTIDEIVIYNG